MFCSFLFIIMINVWKRLNQLGYFYFLFFSYNFFFVVIAVTRLNLPSHYFIYDDASDSSSNLVVEPFNILFGVWDNRFNFMILWIHSFSLDMKLFPLPYHNDESKHFFFCSSIFHNASTHFNFHLNQYSLKISIEKLNNRLIQANVDSFDVLNCITTNRVMVSRFERFLVFYFSKYSSCIHLFSVFISFFSLVFNIYWIQNNFCLFYRLCTCLSRNFYLWYLVEALLAYLYSSKIFTYSLENTTA